MCFECKVNNNVDNYQEKITTAFVCAVVIAPNCVCYYYFLGATFV